MRVGYLKKGIQERFNTKRGWFVNAWRVVDVNSRDLYQPWSNTKREAIDTCKALDIVLIEEEK